MAEPTAPADVAASPCDAGQPKAVIVWDAKTADDPFFEELQPYIEEHLTWAIDQITGANLEVVTNAPGEDVPAILIGKSWLPVDAKARLEKNSQRLTAEFSRAPDNGLSGGHVCSR